MPKFYRQNKKRIDPRYFLNETTNRGEDINEIDMSNQEDQTLQYRQHMDDKKDKLEQRIDMLISSGGLNIDQQVQFANINDLSMDGKLSDEDIKALDAADDESPEALASAIEALYLKMNKGGNSDLSKIDRDGDGKISADQLANIASAIKKNQV